MFHERVVVHRVEPQIRPRSTRLSSRRQTHMARIRQSRPDSGLGVQTKVCTSSKGVPASLESGTFNPSPKGVRERKPKGVRERKPILRDING